jgi:hypothetical protein
MRRLCKTGLDIIQQRTIQRPRHQILTDIVKYRDEILENIGQLEDHLLDNAKCRSMREQLEFWNLYLHRSYILSELCRPTVQTHYFNKEDKELAQSLRKMCLESLANTVEAFLGFQNINKFASQSWAAAHRALSSALLLGILREPLRDNHVQGLLSKLIAVMSEVVSGVDISELSAPLVRSIAALRKLTPPQPVTTDQSMQDSFVFENLYNSDSSRASSMPSPTPAMSGEGGSPYSILNSIIWGHNDSPYLNDFLPQSGL